MRSASHSPWAPWVVRGVSSGDHLDRNDLVGRLVTDLQAAVDWAATEGYGLVGGIGEYEGAWRMAYVRGAEGIIVSLAERIG
jgi:hypothetical protein